MSPGPGTPTLLFRRRTEQPNSKQKWPCLLVLSLWNGPSSCTYSAASDTENQRTRLYLPCPIGTHGFFRTPCVRPYRCNDNSIYCSCPSPLLTFER
ncbi:hypothetical protein LZ32DRAFT_44894 [Colletotrichum eremochloae]|nr:hypothetical protein LZ32DRAFT_44894 [Colletotrichum eremochloae]